VIVVGLTVVAFGTSMPEILVSITAANRGSTSMALGNIMGSNIANIALVLGLAAIVRPVDVGRELLRREVPAVVVLQAMIPLMLIDHELSRIDGFVLFATGLAYNVVLIRDAMAGRRAVEDDDMSEDGNVATNAALFALGVLLLLGGAQLFVGGAVDAAGYFGMDERLIGLTVVALGTSAPEAVTAMVSSYRDQAEMAVGNSLGSNILNISAALGITAMIQPIPFVVGAWKDMGIAMLVTVLLIPIVARGRSLSRTEGLLLTGLYVAFVVMLPSL
jgi:cation:H+ antiporter